MSEVETPVPAAVSAEAPPAQEHKDELNVAEARKIVRKLQKENAEIKAQLEQRAEAEKSELEKQLAKARKEGRSEVEGELGKLRLSSALERELLKRGLDPDLALLVTGKATVESEEDIPGAIDEVLGNRDWLKPRPPGTPGMPTRDQTKNEYPRGGMWTRDQVQEVMANGLYPKYKDEILKHYKVRG